MEVEANGSWPSVPLGEVAELIMGQAPAGSTVAEWDGAAWAARGLPFIQGSAEFGRRFPSPAKWCSEPSKIARPGDYLISVRAPVGELNEVNTKLAIGRGLAAIRFRGVHDRFGWHALWQARGELARMAQGSTFGAINSRDLAGLRIPCPPQLIQISIARVLDAIDEAIEKTEAVIAATEQVRKALLQELLTRGVPGWHTEWKTVPGIGTIPACWEVVRLGDCGAWLSGGTPSKDRSDYWSGAVPWISPKDMKRRELFDAIDHVTEAGARAGSRIVEPGTIFLVVRGMILAHSFPVAIARVRCAFNQDIKGLVCHSDISPDFLLAVLESRKAELLHLPTPSTHGTMRVITEELQSLMVPKPALKEQGRIAELVAAVDLRWATERCHLDELKRVKDLEADALLSGRVRVPADTEVL